MRKQPASGRQRFAVDGAATGARQALREGGQINTAHTSHAGQDGAVFLPGFRVSSSQPRLMGADLAVGRPVGPPTGLGAGRGLRPACHRPAADIR